MCGIAGVLSFGNTPLPLQADLVLRMGDSLAHRGPDGAGTWISDDRSIAFGHRRLSIIDLSAAAAQPMCNEDGTVWITFNGEIYNHASLRHGLKQCGSYSWKTDHSDTEVILHAFEQWGIDCVHRFRGMFAFALWDSRRRELWLVRDRIGIKPLYYSFHHGRITFASEIKALLQDSDQTCSVDEEALYHYLSFLTTPAPLTLFEGIRKLPAATWLRVREDGTAQQCRYWDAWDHTEGLAGISEEEIAERLLSELRTSVRLRKVSDVPVGVFLSGGIDSSINAALFSEGEVAPVHCFSVGYDENYRSYPNELPYARAMASSIGGAYHERILSQRDLLDFLPRMIELQDEPIGDPVCVPVYYLAELARQNGVKVCQLGEGSDELFCGYPAWRLKLWLQRFGDMPFPKQLKEAGLWSLKMAGRGNALEYEFLRRNVTDRPVFWGGAEAFTDSHKRSLLSPRLRRRFSAASSWDVLVPIHRRFEERAWEKSSLNWMTYLDLNLRLPELLLMRVDKMTMGAGVEGRVPFLDHELVQFALSIPTVMKLGNGQLKHILKKAVQGLIPDRILARKKQGFGVPISEWFLDRLGAFARAELQGFCRESDLLDSAAVMALFDQGDGRRMWYLLNLALWWKQHINKAATTLYAMAG